MPESVKYVGIRGPLNFYDEALLTPSFACANYFFFVFPSPTYALNLCKYICPWFIWFYVKIIIYNFILTFYDSDCH